ncbi:hypothetical protein Tco_0213400 [Tanacetum coccineum]
MLVLKLTEASFNIVLLKLTEGELVYAGLAQDGHTIMLVLKQYTNQEASFNIVLLKLTEGELVYAGPAGNEPLTYFSKFGYIYEDYVNPAEFLADLISIDYSR